MSKVTDKLMRSIAAYFELGSVIRFKDAGGYANENAFLDTTEGSYVIKIMNEYDAGALGSEVSYLEKISAAGFRCPTYLSNGQGTNFYVDDGCTVVVMPLLPGSVCDTISMHQIENLGAALARLHLIDFQDLPVRRTWWHPDFLGNGLSIARSRYSDHAISRLEREIDELPRLPAGELHRSIVHGDARSVNALFHGHQFIALIDWEETNVSNSIFDLAHLTIYSCLQGQEFSTELFHALLNGYQSIREIEPVERDYFNATLRRVACTTYLWLILREHPRETQLAEHWASKWYWNLGIHQIELLQT